MSRLAEKKNSIVMNSTGAGAKEITKGNISFIIPNEQPNQNEATVSIDIKDIRFGGQAVSVPEVTAIVNGSKVVASVPFKEPLNYYFKRIEDDMVFKFAVTSAGDLLGFIYLELPQRYKTMKKFHIDEWIPVKHLPSEERDKMFQENFVARIVIDYKGLRKLEDAKQETKLPKAQMLEDLTKNMKATVNSINEEIELFQDEGFKHLRHFEKKLLKKKLNLGSKVQDPNKQKKVPPGEGKLGHPQKELFYQTRGAMGETMEVKAQALAPTQFFDKTIHVMKVNKEVIGDCSRCENLVKELQFSHKELSEASQKITNLEQGKVVVDNDKLKKELEKLFGELNKDRKEIGMKLKDSGSLLEQETKKIRRHYEGETGRALSQQSEAKLYIEDLRAKLKLLEQRENKVDTQASELMEVEARVATKEAQADQEATNLDFERIALEEQELEMTEMKSRMMLERQRVCEEANELQFLKGDTELRQKQMAAMEAFLNEEKESFRRYVDKKNAEVDRTKAELEAFLSDHGEGRQTFLEEQQEYERKNQELVDAIAKHKQEVAKFNREKKAFLSHLKEFSSDKGTIDAERAAVLKEIEKDYEYLEEKNRLLNEQKTELENLTRQLDEYEASLQNQNRLQQEQNARFALQQRQFFKKVNDTNFDPKELKKLGDELGATINAVDEKYEETQKRERDIARQRATLKKNLDSIAEATLSEAAELNRSSVIADRRPTGKTRNLEDASAMSSMQAENKIKIQQDAFKLVDKIFNNAVMGAYKRQNGQKDQLILDLRASVDKLENRLKEMHKKIKTSKLNFFTSKGPTSQKIKVISNPFAGKALNDMEHAPHQEVVGEKEVELAGGKGGDRLAEFQEQVEDAIDAGIKIINDLSKGKQTAKSKARIEYLIQTRKAVQANFELIKNVNSGHQGDFEAPRYEYDDFDLERLRSNLETKLKDLVQFILKVRKNNDFFNPNIDNEILEA